MEELMVKIEDVSKVYRLGQIGGTTLREELQRKKAKVFHKEDPTKRVDAKEYHTGETFRAIDGVSLEIKKGERVGIIGHNGAGKSTLLKLLSRVTAPTSGRIGLNGRIASMLEVGTGFHGELTGRENIYMNGAILGMTKKEIDAKIEDIIDFSECRQFIDTPVKRYSSGMYVKLAFSVAAHLDAEIMIMDEVLAVGDMAFQKKCLDKMNDVSRREGRTILYVSHNMNTIRKLCDRVVVLDHGKIIFDGEVEKGIEVYMGIKMKSETYVDLEHICRDGEFDPHCVTMNSLHALNTENSIYKVGDQISICLTCVSDRAIEEAFLRIIIKTVEGVPVTMLTANKGVKLRKNIQESLTFDIDVSSIVPGRYTINPVIYEVNEFGTYINLDGLKDVYCFEIEQTPDFNNNMIWQSRYWGHFYNKPLNVEVK